jgi:ubiquinone/menaquinone biosynthesis C-methylase UbiE
MSQNLTENSAVRHYDATTAAGSDKRYPTTNLVRLEHRFFEHKPGRMLEYAFGTGCNLIHLLECGHTIDAIDTSSAAKKVVEGKLAKRPDIKDLATLHVLPEDAKGLPFQDAQFDYVNCMSLLSLLGTPERIDLLLAEFNRVLKPGGKIIADINGPESIFATFGTATGNQVYDYGGGKDGLEPFPCYCPDSPDDLVKLMEKQFIIDDVGFAAHKLFNYVEQEFIVCAHKAS